MWIKKIINKENCEELIGQVGFLFEYGIILKKYYHHIEVLYASNEIHLRYSRVLMDLLKVPFPNIMQGGSYSMLPNHSVKYFYTF